MDNSTRIAHIKTALDSKCPAAILNVAAGLAAYADALPVVGDVDPRSPAAISRDEADLTTTLEEAADVPTWDDEAQGVRWAWSVLVLYASLQASIRDALEVQADL